MNKVFKSLGLPEKPILLAPLAGVSDHPFRRICSGLGADLTYVEMISATALVHHSQRTLGMLTRHSSEEKLGVQVTSRNEHEMGEAVAILDKMNFDTIDINMGCPVRKVVKVGCGSAILKDPERVYRTTLAAVKATSKPLSVKIRLGWDHQSINFKEVALAAQEAGACWITMHGRTRSDTYGEPVHLDKLAELKKTVDIPVIGNGNIFCSDDAKRMYEVSNVDAVMVSRGALGNPWIFREIKTDDEQVSLDDWLATIMKHLSWQEEAYGPSGYGSIAMRKHVLWYVKGWPHAKKVRDQIVRAQSIADAKDLLLEYAQLLDKEGIVHRASLKPSEDDKGHRFLWDPKFEMDRKLDRGVGDDHMDATN